MHSTYLDANRVHCLRGSKRHSQIYSTFVSLWLATVRIRRRTRTCSCRVVGGLLENQLHIRWIIRHARERRRDIRGAPHGERNQTRGLSRLALSSARYWNRGDPVVCCVYLVKIDAPRREKVARKHCLHLGLHYNFRKAWDTKKKWSRIPELAVFQFDTAKFRELSKECSILLENYYLK